MEEAAIIGSGAMGAEMAQVMATAGMRVLLLDSSTDFLTNATGGIKASLDRLVKKKNMSEEAAGEVLKRIEPVVATNDYSCLANADLVLEVVPDKLALKEKVLKAVCATAKPSAIIASNTSSLSITRCAGFLPADRTARFAGLHLFDPVPAMKSVEVVQGLQTNDETIKELMQLCLRLGKTGVPCIDCPGFECNRILVPMINEAMFAVSGGVAADADKVKKLGANYLMGQLLLADTIGLDRLLSVMDVLYQEFEDSKYRACPLLREMVDAGQLGRKTGKGFFDYGKRSKL